MAQPSAYRSHTKSATSMSRPQHGAPSSRTENSHDESMPKPKNDITSSQASMGYSNATQATEVFDPKRMFIPRCLHYDQVIYDILTTATTSPPVTKDTLSELDLTWIMNNISLRCDVNYDHDLHFMPITGKRGDEKRENAKKYWFALQTELRIYLHNIRRLECERCNAATYEQSLDFPQRLPEMFENLRVLLETLVPDRDHDQVHENVDVEFLMQQVSHGVFNAARMSSWLAKLLKTHCAPMRDEWADAMSKKIDEGASDLTMASLVDGLQKLFSFLEAMKLDVANHQIRTLRYFLIEDTVAFQKEYFKKRITNGKLSPSGSHDWYRREAKHYKVNCNQDFAKLRAGVAAFASFMHGLTRLCKSDEPEGEPSDAIQIPSTLHYDRNRIQQLREDMQDWIYLKICLEYFNELTRQLIGHSSPVDHRRLRDRLLAMTEGEASKSVAETWRGQVEPIGMEITRLAFEIFRGSCGPIQHEEFVKASRQIGEQFTRRYPVMEEEFLDALEKESFKQACIFQKLSALELSEAQKEWQQKRQLKGPLRHVTEIEDMARRLAHMGVLHWEIWSELVYLDLDGSGQRSDGNGNRVGYESDAREEDLDDETSLSRSPSGLRPSTAHNY